MTGPFVLPLRFLCFLAVAAPTFLLGRAVLGRIRFNGGAEMVALSTALGRLSRLLLFLGVQEAPSASAR